MSETAEREMELVAGVIGGITQKKADTWTVAVTPEGSQYAKNLWTKDANLIESLSVKIGQEGAFVTSASYWTRQDGQQVRSLWITQEGTEGVTIEKPAERVATPAASSKAAAQAAVGMIAKAGSEGVDWDAKERRDYRSRAWAQTLGAFGHTIKTDEDPLAVFQRLHPFQMRVYRDVVRGLFQPDDDDIPF